MLNELLPDNVKLFPAAVDDFFSLDKSQQIKVVKALQKIAKGPNKFGKRLESKPNHPLAGYRSIYADRKKMRIIWKVVDSNIIEVAIIAGIAQRDGLAAYKMVTSSKETIEALISSLTEPYFIAFKQGINCAACEYCTQRLSSLSCVNKALNTSFRAQSAKKLSDLLSLPLDMGF
ncbi:MAG TPA: hypothetical protein VJ036_00420 [bacterium]|nr:hypothetical protein [bacterium]